VALEAPLRREWFAKFTPSWAANHSSKILRRLEQDIFPWIGARPMAAITASDLASALNEQGRHRDATECQLPHAERDAVCAAYNFAEHLPERKSMIAHCLTRAPAHLSGFHPGPASSAATFSSRPALSHPRVHGVGSFLPRVPAGVCCLSGQCFCPSRTLTVPGSTWHSGHHSRFVQSVLLHATAAPVLGVDGPFLSEAGPPSRAVDPEL
jgi:hypothetical protein